MAGLITEMTQKVSEAARAQAKATSAAEADRRRLDAATGRVIRLEKGAAIAVKSGQVDVARQAIAVQIRAEQDQAACHKRLEVSESAMRSAREVRRQLQENLRELKHRKKQILSRIREVRAKQELVGEWTSPATCEHETVLDLVAKMEADLEEEEAKIEIRDQIEKTLGMTFEHERVKELESDQEVERRLNELKKQAEQRD